LTKNEKKVLKILLQNSRTTDSEIGTELKISSQAVGKIRRKLESTIISGYGLNIDFSKLGIQTFAISVARLTMAGLDKGGLEVEQLLLENPHILHVYRLPKGSSTHILVYGFSDINEFDNFFSASRMRDELHKFLEIQDLYTFSHNSLIKSSSLQLFNKVIDNLNQSPSAVRFQELESFKKRLQ